MGICFVYVLSYYGVFLGYLVLVLSLLYLLGDYYLLLFVLS